MTSLSYFMALRVFCENNLPFCDVYQFKLLSFSSSFSLHFPDVRRTDTLEGEKNQGKQLLLYV